MFRFLEYDLIICENFYIRFTDFLLIRKRLVGLVYIHQPILKKKKNNN